MEVEDDNAREIDLEDLGRFPKCVSRRSGPRRQGAVRPASETDSVAARGRPKASILCISCTVPTHLRLRPPREIGFVRPADNLDASISAAVA